MTEHPLIVALMAIAAAQEALHAARVEEDVASRTLATVLRDSGLPNPLYVAEEGPVESLVCLILDAHRLRVSLTRPALVLFSHAFWADEGLPTFAAHAGLPPAVIEEIARLDHDQLAREAAQRTLAQATLDLREACDVCWFNDPVILAEQGEDPTLYVGGPDGRLWLLARHHDGHWQPQARVAYFYAAAGVAPAHQQEEEAS